MGEDWRKELQAHDGGLAPPDGARGGGGPGDFDGGILDGGHASEVPHPRSPAGRRFDWSALPFIDLGDRLQAVMDASEHAERYAGSAIYEATGEELSSIVDSLVPGLLLVLKALGISTGVGALVGGIGGFFAGGGGAIPGAFGGATAGLETGLFLMEYFGLGYLAGSIAATLGDATVLARNAVTRAWNSVDEPDTQAHEIELAAQELASALALVVRGVLQGVVLYVMGKGAQLASARAIEVAAKLRGSRLGGAFASWVEQRGVGLAKNPKLSADAEASGGLPRVGSGGSGGGAGRRQAGEASAPKSAPEAPAPKRATSEGEATSSSSEPAGDRNQVARDETTNTGHPVDVATGKVFTDKTDVALPGVLGLCWQRVWYSTSSYAGPLGHGWHHSYDASLTVQADAVHYHTPDGRSVAFPVLGLGQSHFHPVQKLTLLRDATGGYTVRDKARLLWRFGATGRSDNALGLQSIEHPGGRRVSLRHDELGRLRELTDGSGRSVAFEHDAFGRISALIAPHPDRPGERLELVRYHYDQRGDLTEVRDALGHVARYRYAHHLLVQETDPSGLSFYFEYDAQDASARCIHTWGDGGLYDHKLSYDDARSITTVENSLGFKTQYEHRRGRVIRTVDALGGITIVEYDANANRLARVDAQGKRTRYRYDARGNCTGWTGPDGVRWTARYDADDRLLGVWQGDLPRFTLAYDAQGRVTQRTDALGAQTRFEYDGPHLSAVIDPAGQRTRLEYDAHGDLTQQIASNGAVTRWKYDALGRMRACTDPRGNTQTRELDLLGRVRRVREPDGNVRNLEYDAMGNVARIQDKHRDVQLRYRGLGRLSTRSEAGTLVVFEYDTEERLRTVLNEHGEAYRFERGPTGEVEREFGFGGLRRSYRRNLLGLVTQIERGNGLSTRYAYDAMDRLTHAVHSDGDEERYQYREDGALLEASNSARQLRFERDALGRVLEEHQDGHVVTSRYDARGLRTHMRSSLGADQHITRGKLGEVTALESGPWRAQFSRDLLGDELERELPGGVRSRRHIDALGRVASHEVVTADKILRARSYRWDVDQRLLELIDVDHGAVRYSYDARGRLAVARYTDGTDELRMPDAVGNLFKTENRGDRSYGPAGELLEVRTRSGDITRYKYDLEGNLTEKLEPSGRTWHYRWNAAGRLAAVTRPDGNDVVFAYDALGRRVRKHHRGQTTHFIWDGQVPLHEWVEGSLEAAQPASPTPNETDSLLKKREAELQALLAQGPPTRGTSAAPITWLFEPESFRPIGKLLGGEQLSITTDMLGAPFLMTDARGKAQWSSSIDTYGSLHHLKGNPHACPFRFQGQYEDAETGLHYNGHRYYDPQAGRYISQDPIGLAGGTALYDYCADPLGWADPLGLCGKDVAPGDLPTRLARVVPDTPVTRRSGTLGAPGADDVFVTTPDDIAGLDAAGIAQRLTIPESPSGFRVTEFDTPASGLASPVNRTNPGFVGGGRTAGGANEFVVPNGPVPATATTRVVR